MKRANRKKPSKGVATSSNESSAHTAEQREQMQRGLRILARMIVRAHLRGELPRAALPSPKPSSEKASGG